jgi:hypothetical protein
MKCCRNCNSYDDRCTEIDKTDDLMYFLLLADIIEKWENNPDTENYCKHWEEKE